jgi:hypothetical protein
MVQELKRTESGELKTGHFKSGAFTGEKGRNTSSGLLHSLFLIAVVSSATVRPATLDKNRGLNAKRQQRPVNKADT